LTQDASTILIISAGDYPSGRMQSVILQQIAEIRKRMECRKGFQCAESGFEELCRAKDIGLKRHLLCLEKAASSCDFALLIDRKYYCACPLRVYLTKNLRKQKIARNLAV